MRSRYLVLLIVLLLIAQSAVFIARRVRSPSDTAYFVLLQQDSWQPDGMPVRPLIEYPGGIRSGDVIVAVEGVSLDTWMRHAMDPDFQRPRWAVGDTAEYTVRRGTEVITLDQPLGRFPLADHLRAAWLSDVINLIFLGMAVFLFVKKPDETIARVLLLVAAAQMTTNWEWGIQTTDIVGGSSFVHYLFSGSAVFMLIWSGYLHFALIFPRPSPLVRAHPRITTLLYIVPYVFIGSWWWVTWQATASAGAWINQAMNPVMIILVFYAVLTLGAVAYTFFTVRDPVGRAQIRWVLFGTVIAFLVTVFVGIVPLFTIGTMLGLERGLALINAAFLLIPLTIVVAVLRYHLFDIDIIVRRTTSYGVLTLLLALIYFGSIVVLQQLLSPLTGESTIAVVLSTLMIAALFLPMRRRVQELIDRHFFRRKYDAEKVMLQFAATVRDETDLDALAAELVRVIQETMQPESVSVWLKMTADRRPRTTDIMPPTNG